MGRAIDDLKNEWLFLADGARYAGERVADMSRDELMALCCYLISRELGRSMYTVRVTNSEPYGESPGIAICNEREDVQ